MHIWGLSFWVGLVAFIVAVGAATDDGNERHQPVSTSAVTTKTIFTTLAPVVVSTIYLQDSRPRPTDSTKSGLGQTTPPLPTVATSSALTPDGSLASHQNNDTSLITAASLRPWDVVPIVVPDVPVTAIFLVLFLAGAAAHILNISRNRRLNIRPTLSALVLAFCVLRVLACLLRIVWATKPGNEALLISEMIFLNIGSLVIFMANAFLAQRLMLHFSLTSMSGSNWRLAVMWLSRLVLVIASLSSIIIIMFDIVGISELANIRISMLAPMLVRVGEAWLFALGAWYTLSVAAVLLSTQTVSRNRQRLRRKLAVFFISGPLLEIGQGFRLGTMSRSVFYTTGFMLEVFVVALYAVADLDHMFYDGHADPSTTARYTTRRRSAIFGFFRNDEHGLPRGAQRPTEQRVLAGGIVIRKSLDISITGLDDDPPPSSAHSGRRPSFASAFSDASVVSNGASKISEINFPLVIYSRPAPVHTASARHVPPHLEARSQVSRSDSINEKIASTASSVSGRPKSSPYSPSSTYNPFGKPQRAGLRMLEMQLEDYDNDIELSEDQRALH